ncbi:MAG: transcription-repair coupling factor [Roseburia sp.]|nr:transcription-repair coupling factor [Roseburia sp.]
MRAFLEPLDRLGEIEKLNKTLTNEKGVQMISGCIDSQKPHLFYGIGRSFPHKIIVTFNEQRAREIYEEYLFFDSQAVYYPAKDILFYQSDLRGNVLTRERILALKRIAEGKKITLITTYDGLMNKMPNPGQFMQAVKTYHVGDVIDLEGLREELVQMGYESAFQVESAGQFAIRGGIIDIFPLTEENPYRIELWDDEIDSVRTFDVESQRSIENMETVELYPATELILSKEEKEDGVKRLREDADRLYEAYRKDMKTEEAYHIKTMVDELTESIQEGGSVGLDAYLTYFCRECVSLLDYLKTEDTLVFLDEAKRCLERGYMTEQEFSESMKHRLEKGYILPGQVETLYTCQEIAARIERRSGVALFALEQKIKEFGQHSRFSLQARTINPYNSSFELLVKDLKQYKKKGYGVILLSGSKTRAKRLAEDLMGEGLNCFYSEDYDHTVKSGEIMAIYGKVKRGYEYPLINFAVISESDIFGTEKKKKKKRRLYEGEKIASFTDLSVGDYVVHENHGLGIYRGIEKLEVDKTVKDYIKIEYDKGGNLYILATQLDMIQKYAGKDAKKPKLNRLGGGEWHKTKTRVRGAVEEIAKDLVELYAKRQENNGYVYGPDTVWQREFEEMFPFEETYDQEAAIEATKRDMESKKIMDRLICGDVGYGKTEIAIRAAFKAVQEGKQVVYLVPTTILAQQHYNTFAQRMKDFPVTVNLLCRFNTAGEQKKTIAELKRGMVDIVIGTHRVLSKDVVFKDLGLLIIDEEQRFGVAHKEKIKKMKENVDVLTLTATPIPRTLHMSLIGIRDMSVLEEPPMDRLPIQTYVMEYNEEMVREAISRELARGGQVYYVFNRVNQIEDVAAKVASLVPQASVQFAHGQMKEKELENIMYQFINGDIDVLISTTIIETGLDISNVNTIIIADADNMGLSQLYQLRGRVGRSNRTAYAFLMYKRDKMLKEVAEKRLAAIKEYTELGSGFKIAMRDLEIRGAGNLLGVSQHGHMEAVGYDLYCKMLNEAVKQAKGIAVEESFETSIDLDIDAFIPPSYIRDEAQKLDVYKRIAGIENEEEKEEMTEELIDRFGDLPKPVENLLTVAKYKAKAHRSYFTEVAQKGEEIRFALFARAKVDPAKIPEFVNLYQGKMKFVPDKKLPLFIYNLKLNSRQKESPMEVVEQVLKDSEILRQ